MLTIVFQQVLMKSRQVRPRSCRTYTHTNSIFDPIEPPPAYLQTRPLNNILQHRWCNQITPQQLQHKNKGKGYPLAVKHKNPEPVKPSQTKQKELRGQLQNNGTEFYWIDDDQNTNHEPKGTSIPSTVHFLNVGYEDHPGGANEFARHDLKFRKKQLRSQLKSKGWRQGEKLFVFGKCQHKCARRCC